MYNINQALTPFGQQPEHVNPRETLLFYTVYCIGLHNNDGDYTESIVKIVTSERQ